MNDDSAVDRIAAEYANHLARKVDDSPKQMVQRAACRVSSPTHRRVSFMCEHAEMVSSACANVGFGSACMPRMFPADCLASN